MIDDLIRLINLGVISIESIKNVDIKAEVQAKFVTE